MSKRFRITVLVLLVTGALTVALTGTAMAQEETPESVAPEPPLHHGFGRGPGGDVALKAIAETLGMTVDELSLQLWGGKSLADLAEEAGVDLQEVQDAVLAAQQEAQREAIEQAVEEGILSREQADWMLEGLENGYWGGHGRGGFGGCHGRGGFGGRNFGGFPGDTGSNGGGLDTTETNDA